MSEEHKYIQTAIIHEHTSTQIHFNIGDPKNINTDRYNKNNIKAS